MTQLILPSICSTMAFPPLGNSDHVVASVSIEFQLELMYIPHHKYQVKLHSSSWFSAACAAATVHRNHFFPLYQQNKSSESKVKFRQAIAIIAKGSLKLPNLYMPIKQKSLSLPRNLALGTFGELSIVFSTKVNLLYLLYSTDNRCCLLHLVKQNCFPRTFL